MTLEQRLARTLRRADAYGPSSDLLARMQHSIEADAAHRRTVRRILAAAVAAVVVVGVYMWLTVSVDPGGRLVVRVWAVELFEIAVLLGSLLALAPMIRRFGRIYVADAFRVSPATGDRFLTLLDLAYYLFFTGVLIIGADLTTLDTTVSLQRGLAGTLDRVAAFLALMGVTHVVNLLAIPAAGLIFGSVHRRAVRRAAGRDAPPLSQPAVAADRVGTWLVFGLAAVVLVGAVLAVGVAIGIGLR